MNEYPGNVLRQAMTAHEGLVPTSGDVLANAVRLARSRRRRRRLLWSLSAAVACVAVAVAAVVNHRAGQGP